MNGDLLNRKLFQADGRLARMLKDPKLTDETLVTQALSADLQPAAHRRRDGRGQDHLRRGARAGPSGPRTCSGRCSTPRNSCSTTDWIRHEPNASAAATMIGARRCRIGSRPILVALLALGLSLARAVGPRPMTRPRRPTSATSSRSSPSDARSVTARRSATNPDVSGGLALDSFEAVLAGTTREKVVVPGRSAESELVQPADRCGRGPADAAPGQAAAGAAARADPPLDRRRSAARECPCERPPANAAGDLAGPHRVRWVRSLEVVLPT